MSEVHRYDVVVMLSEAGGRISYDPHGPEIVMASDYDALAAQRDEGLAREAELRLKVESKDRLIEQGFKTLDRVHCMWAKRLLDATGIPSQVLIPDEEFVKYFEELKGLKKRLAEADRKYDEALAEMQAVIDTGVLTAADYESLEAEICARITDYWKRPTKPGPGCEDGEKQP